ncbi:hypothetical protein ATO12_02910 [Aquimarina atlantica]|uniref:Uncharacterized protein n=1 Tax=Aquimarina atlantica TaxID=1317122 RepID=A0A023C0H0_9FLAO|nr:hypothetical protein ATO12_02910 [Aquimarina atlantica]
MLWCKDIDQIDAQNVKQTILIYREQKKTIWVKILRIQNNVFFVIIIAAGNVITNGQKMYTDLKVMKVIINKNC